METCSCGRALSAHDRHEWFGLPDAVLELPERENTEGAWSSHEDPWQAVMMEIPGAGAFVRCLLPVRLIGGSSVTFGVWVAVRSKQLHGAFSLWWSDDYPQLVVTGQLGNALPGWGLLGAPVRATVLNPEHTPTCTSSEDEQLGAVLGREWEHDQVLAAFD